MKPFLFLLLLALAGTVEGRAFNQNECRGLAAIANSAATLRDKKAPLMFVLAAADEALLEAEGNADALVRFDGDAQALISLVIATYKSSYSPEEARRIVYDMCNRHELSKTIREV